MNTSRLADPKKVCYETQSLQNTNYNIQNNIKFKYQKWHMIRVIQYGQGVV